MPLKTPGPTEAVPAPTATYSAFISYASEDAVKAEDICDHLEAQGLRCWIAPRDVRAGREYANEIILGIERSRCLVLVLSAAANRSQFVKREVERAVTKGRPLIPVRIEEVLPSPGLELFVAATHWIDAWTGEWADDMDQLVQAVTDALATGPGGRTTPAAIAGQTGWSARRVLAAAAGVLLVAALAGVAYWYERGEATGQPSSGPSPSATSPGPTSIPVPQSGSDSRLPSTGSSASGPPARQESGPAREVTSRQGGDGPQRTPPPRRVEQRVEATPPPQPAADSEALEELRQQATMLTLRAETVEGSLERLAEQMRPNGLRGDIVLRQQSAASSLANGHRALERGNLATAVKYFELARADVEALERFLGR